MILHLVLIATLAGSGQPAQAHAARCEVEPTMIQKPMRAEVTVYQVSPQGETARTAAILRYVKDAGPGEKAAQAFDGIFRQHRVGRFELECRVLDGERLLGVGRGDLEILFKGNFFEQKAFRKP